MWSKSGLDHFHWISKSGFFKFPLLSLDTTSYIVSKRKGGERDKKVGKVSRFFFPLSEAFIPIDHEPITSVKFQQDFSSSSPPMELNAAGTSPAAASPYPNPSYSTSFDHQSIMQPHQQHYYHPQECLLGVRQSTKNGGIVDLTVYTFILAMRLKKPG